LREQADEKALNKAFEHMIREADVCEDGFVVILRHLESVR
jgi:hypothetical protein